MEDMAPALIADATAEFRRLYDASDKIRVLLGKVKEGTATFAEAQQYSIEVSRLIGVAYEKHISSAVLPDGRMYFNIASRLIPSTMDENYKFVSDYAVEVQKKLNEKAGIGLRAKAAEQDADRIEGLVNLASSAERYDDVSGQLLTAFENFSQSIVDKTIEANADFQYRAGMNPKIVRKAERKCCDWCSNLAGEYDYPMDMPEDVFRRHENCRCTVLYDPADGKHSLQNVHTKRLTSAGERDIIEERKKIGLDRIDTFRPNEYDANIRSYVNVDREKVLDASKNGKKHGHSGVYLDAMGKNRKQLQKSIVSRAAQVEHHADKIRHPENYVPDWEQKSPQFQQGLLKKWEKDMRRNAEQAEIELAVFEERF